MNRGQDGDPAEILQIVADNEYEGVIYVDDGGIVRFISQSYADFLNINREAIIGRYINDVVPQSMLVEVMKSGKPQFGDVWNINGQHVLVHRFPIFKDGKVVGCLGKSLFKDELSLAREFIRRVKWLEDELAFYRDELDKERRAKYDLDQIIGKSDVMVKLKEKVARVAKTNSTVLITGESGTGKELLAHAIHNASPRRYRPFVRINCTSIPEDLLESELFGYEEGSFTGAKKGGKVGKFEQAQGGTILLDEIGDMNRTMQAKLLRVLQEKEIERIGGVKPIPVDVRVIASTNRNLEEMIRTNLFRQDLYYRLNVVLLFSPPLRNRKEDIPLLTKHLINQLNESLGTGTKGVTPETLQLFLKYDWPGNVRELKNLLEQAINLSDAGYLAPADFPILLKRLSVKKDFSAGLKNFAGAMDEAEREILAAALARSGGNKKEAARLLNIHRSVLYRKLKKHGLLKG
ncbi:MAG: sigma 54-interacting transcriptional regulator [Peptococcaceae bacterium]|nr:sigma 54-interacting transcriptional regulator [Peptococcaceae bacterium]